MKKSKKLGALALCALVSASTLTVGPEVINSVKADDTDLKIPALQKTYETDSNGYVVIPELNQTGETVFSTKVYALGTDVEVTDEDTTDTSKFKFKPSAKQYKVVYTGVKSDKTPEKSDLDKADLDYIAEMHEAVDRLIREETHCGDEIVYHIDKPFDQMDNVIVVTLNDKNKNITYVFESGVFLLNSKGQTVQKLA